MRLVDELSSAGGEYDVAAEALTEATATTVALTDPKTPLLSPGRN